MNMVMKSVWFMVVFLILVISADARTVRLRLGEPVSTHEVSFPVARMHLQGERFVSADSANGNVRLTPLAAGRASLTLYDAAGAVREEWQILVADGAKVPLEAVREILKDEKGQPFPTLFCAEVPGSELIQITGLVREPLHLERIRIAEQVFEGGIINLTRIDAPFYDRAVSEIQKQITVPGIKVSHAGGRVFLTGQAFAVSEKAYVEAVARAIYPQVESFLDVRRLGVPDYTIEKPLIQMECQILEISTDSARRIGIDVGGILPITVSAGWSSESGGGGPSGFVSLNTEYLINALIPQIETGDAKILYTQNLVCENGEEARFFSGGSFWIVTAVPGTGDVSSEEVEYGISMDLQPIVDSFNNIGTKVNIEFSNIGPAVAGYPSLLKRYVRTSVNVKRGQTLTLGSLLGSDIRESIKKVPLLGDIPVFGELFKSKSFQEGKSEMIILITPRVVVAGDPSNEEMKRSIQQRVEKK